MSFRKIHYKLRPAKTVERKMIAESLRKLNIFHPLSDYQYIGFGSIYFADFSLFHKALGMTKLISIEKQQSASERVVFNKPFSCIDVRFGFSKDILPVLDYSIPSIIWLDYDGKLTSDCLVDINTVCAKCVPGSMLLVTVNVQPELKPNAENEENSSNGVESKQYDNSLFEYRFSKLIQQVSRSKIPAAVTGKDLNINGLPNVVREIMHNEVLAALDDRNGTLQAEERIAFRQIFNIRYSDGASMLTFGGIFLNNISDLKFIQEGFYNLPFCTEDQQSYMISVPNLTTKEVVLLDSILHESFDFNTSKLKSKRKEIRMIPESEISEYAKIYRFYPTFTESIW